LVLLLLHKKLRYHPLVAEVQCNDTFTHTHGGVPDFPHLITAVIVTIEFHLWYAKPPLSEQLSSFIV
jgi:hypothetical protein